jgi:hypothetical protein
LFGSLRLSQYVKRALLEVLHLVEQVIGLRDLLRLRCHDEFCRQMVALVPTHRRFGNVV